VTLLVDPEEAERLTLASTEGKIQLALRNPLDKTTPLTHGIRPPELLGYGAPVKTAANRSKLSSVKAMGANASVVVPVVSAPPDLPSVEIIRGDKRTHETVRQE
jgi:pilus assembly protein CpaB